MNAPEHVGVLIRRLRDQAGLTQGQLAEYAHVTRAWLAGVEAGNIQKPEREKLQRVATILRVPAETLLAAAGYRVSAPPEAALAEHPLISTILAAKELSRAVDALDIRDPELTVLFFDFQREATPEQLASLRQFMIDAREAKRRASIIETS